MNSAARVEGANSVGRNKRIRSFVSKRLRSFLAGVLLTSGLPPFGWWILALLGAALLARSMQHRSWRERFRQANAAGLGFLGVGLFWIAEFHLFGYLLGVGIATAFFGLVVSLAPYSPANPRNLSPTYSGSSDPSGWLFLTFPAALVLADALRSAWPYGGVPIALVSQTQIGGPLAELARLGGGLAITAAVGIIGVSLAFVLPHRAKSPEGSEHRAKLTIPRMKRNTFVAASFATLVVVATAIAASSASNGRNIGSLRVAIVQGGGERGTRAINTDPMDVINAHLAASADVPKGVDLVLWPEDVLETQGALSGSSLDNEMAELARDFDAPIAAGVFEIYDTYNRNAAVVWTKEGKLTSRYEKNQLVPFGEFVPMRSLVESLVDVSAIPNDAVAGKGPALLETSAGNLGVVICYEIFFSRRTRAAMSEGAEVLYVPTNANSFVTTQMPALELAAARLRAIETGRYVLQTAPTGFSAFIDPDGNVMSQTDMGAREVLTERVQRRSGSTLYTRMGDGPIVVFALVTLATARMRRPKVGSKADN